MTARQVKAKHFAGLGFFMLTGLIMTSYGTYWMLLTKQFLAKAEFTNGIVVDLKRAPGSGAFFSPVFRFKDANGTERVVAEDVASDSSPFCIGQTVPIAFPPGDPLKARIQAFGTLWFFPVLISGMGVLFSLVSGIGLDRVIFGGARYTPWVT